MMSRNEKRRAKKAKLAKTGRVQRLKKRLTGIHNRKVKHEGNVHTTALMESYIVRRKAARAAEKQKAEAQEAKAKENNGAEKNEHAPPSGNQAGSRRAPLPAAQAPTKTKTQTRQPSRPVTRSLY